MPASVKGMLCVGQNPATSLNAKLERAAMRKLEWLVVKDNWLHETANYWKTAPEVASGEVKPQDIKTEVFFFPGGAGCRNRGHVYEYAADDADAFQGGSRRPAIVGPTSGSSTSSASV